MNSDWYVLWAVVVAIPVLVGVVCALLKPDNVIPYHRVNDCKPGAFSVGKDCK